MKISLVVQLLVLTAFLALGAYLVIDGASGWQDWVVFGVIVGTALGLAIAVHKPLYTTKKRTFVKEYKRPRR